MSVRFSSPALVALLLAGCVGPRAVGHFGEHAFYHARDHYRVRYLPRAPQYALLPEGWRLESYVFDDDGRPLEASSDPRFVQLYDTTTLSGRLAPVWAERFDLFFAENAGDATMWARTMPLDGYWEGLDIAFLMRLAVARIGRDLRAPDLLGTTGYRFLSDVVADRSARIDGHRAHAVTFDVLMPAGENPVAHRRVTVVGIEIAQARWRQGRVGRPMLLVFGYASSPDAHLAERATFESFVSRVDLR